MSLRLISGLLRRGGISRQFADAHFAPLRRRAFAFQPHVAFAPVAIIAAAHFLSIHAQPQLPVLRRDQIMIPLRRRLAALLARETAHPVVPPERHHRGPVNREHIAMRRVALRIAVTVVEHLHLDRPQKRLPFRRNRRGPDENARIPRVLHVPPLHLHLEVLIHPRRAQRPDGLARAANHAIHHAPRLRRTIHIHPVREILPVEKIHPTVIGGECSSGEERKQEKTHTQSARAHPRCGQAENWRYQSTHPAHHNPTRLLPLGSAGY